MTDDGTAPRIAYLISAYPKLSHSFISSEIAGLRASGVRVDTFSVNEPSDPDLLTEASRAEARTTTYLIAAARRQPGHWMLYALRRPDVAVCGLLAAARMSSRILSLRWLFYWIEALVLLGELRRRGLRRVHVHLANNAADVAHIATVMGRRDDHRDWGWSLSVHGPNELSDTSGYNLAAKVASADFVACITEYCRSQVMALTDVERWPALHVVRMGIEPDDFTYVERGDRDAAAPLHVLFVGRLVKEKAPMLLLDALTRLERGRVSLRVVGDGELRAALTSRVERDGLHDEVTFVGPVGQDRLQAEYAWADVFCLPSFAEGLPVVLMEAMATGLPVISSRIAGIPELVTAETGKVISPGNVDDLVAALLALYDPAERNRLGSAGRLEVMKRHIARHNAGSLAELFGRHERPFDPGS